MLQGCNCRPFWCIPPTLTHFQRRQRTQCSPQATQICCDWRVPRAPGARATDRLPCPEATVLAATPALGQRPLSWPSFLSPARPCLCAGTSIHTPFSPCWPSSASASFCFEDGDLHPEVCFHQPRKSGCFSQESSLFSLSGSREPRLVLLAHCQGDFSGTGCGHHSPLCSSLLCAGAQRPGGSGRVLGLVLRGPTL